MSPDFAGHGHPRKILADLRALGVHNDCLIADDLGACGECLRLVHLVYDTHYGHHGSIDDFREAVLTDMIDDQIGSAA